MTTYKKQIILGIVSVFILIALGVSIFIQIRESSVREMNERQKIYARLAAKGIETIFNYHIAVGQALARNPHIVVMDSEGRQMIRTGDKAASSYLKGIIRLNASGERIYAFPAFSASTGADLFVQDHARKVRKEGKLAVSDVFDAGKGLECVAIHVPVYRGKNFDGTIALLVNFTELAKDYLDNLHVPGKRYAMLINSKGKIIHCFNPQHSGRSFLEICPVNSEAAGLIRSMTNGEEGEASFVDAHLQTETNRQQKVHAVYTPVRTGDEYWSIAVISSELLMLPAARNSRVPLIILAIALVAFFALSIYLAARIRGTRLETRKRGKIEEELIQSAQEIHDLYSNAPCGYHSLNADGCIVRVNDMEISWLGYTREELIGQHYTLILAEASRERFVKGFSRLKKERMIRDIEYDFRRKDGTTFPVLVTASAITDSRGNFVMTRSMVIDMTERRAQEEQLRESEALYRKALENTSDGVTILQDGKYVYASPRLLDTIGRPESHLTDQPLGTYVHPDDWKQVTESYLRRKQGDPIPSDYELRVVKPDQTTIYLFIKAVIVTYGGKPAILSFIQDITRQKEAENALRESEEFYRTAFEKTHDGISIMQDEKHVYVNGSLLKTLGREESELIGKPLGAYVHPDDLEKLEQYFTARVQGKPAPANYEIRVMKPDETCVTLDVNAIRVVYQGKPATLSFVTDITKRKRAEEALRESEALYRTALEKTNDGISIIQDGAYVYANPKLLKTIGRQASGLVGLPLGVFTHPDDRGRVRERYEARQRGERLPSRYDFRVLKPDGSVITIHINSVVITYNGKPATLSFVLDVTRRRQAEEALRQSEERYRTIFESIDEDYFETDLEGISTFLNKPVSWSGFRREELLGMKFGAQTSPDMAQKIRSAFGRIYRGNKSARISDCEIFRKDGSLAQVEMSVSLMRDARGNPIGFRGLSRDVSERFRMETERRKLTEQLHQAQKMEAIGTLAGGIAHDFNNLLMGIQGYTSLMLLDAQAAHLHYEQLQAVQSLVQSGANLTRQLLGFARAGRFEVVTTDLNDLIGKSVHLFARTKKEIRVFEKYAEEIWPVEADRGQIEQVLLNMFVNAWQAMPGGGSLYLETANVSLDDAHGRNP